MAEVGVVRAIAIGGDTRWTTRCLSRARPGETAIQNRSRSSVCRLRVHGGRITPLVPSCRMGDSSARSKVSPPATSKSARTLPMQTVIIHLRGGQGCSQAAPQGIEYGRLLPRSFLAEAAASTAGRRYQAGSRGGSHSRTRRMAMPGSGTRPSRFYDRDDRRQPVRAASRPAGTSGRRTRYTALPLSRATYPGR